MFKGLNQVIDRLKLIEKSQPLIIQNFFQKATDWIIDEANFKLEESLHWDKNTFGSYMYEKSENGWKVEILNDRVILTNEFENSASVEFGIGIVGANEPHPIANKVGYRYNVASEYKDDNGAWNFYDEFSGMYYVKFRGYRAKSFLYNTTLEFFTSGIYAKIYKQVFDEIVGKICKGVD